MKHIMVKLIQSLLRLELKIWNNSTFDINLVFEKMYFLIFAVPHYENE